MHPNAPTARFQRPLFPFRGGTVLGLLFGIAVGTMIALGAAWYVTRHSPFRDKESPPASPPMTIPQELVGMLRQPPSAPAPSGSNASPPATSAATGQTPPPLTSAPLPVPQQNQTAAALPAPSPPPTSATPPTTSAASALGSTSSAPPSESAPQRWFWQVGAFGSEQEANRVRAELALLGVSSVAEPAKMPDGRMLYRVRVGPYPSQQAAEAARGRLQAAGYQPVLVRG